MQISRSQLSAEQINLAQSLNLLLEQDNRENRSKLRRLFSDPLFIPQYQLSLTQQRELALRRLQEVTSHRLISVHDFEKNPLNIFSSKTCYLYSLYMVLICIICVAHEIAGMNDGSFATKMTVQFNLFGGTIVKLGTERHRWILDGINSLNDIGCFALTELGYGNNAIEMETTAVYHHPTREIIINTPSILAQKYWITNSAGIHASSYSCNLKFMHFCKLLIRHCAMSY